MILNERSKLSESAQCVAHTAETLLRGFLAQATGNLVELILAQYGVLFQRIYSNVSQ